MEAGWSFFEAFEKESETDERVTAVVDVLATVCQAARGDEGARRYFPHLEQCTTLAMRGEADEQQALLLVAKNGLVTYLLGLPNDEFLVDGVA